jgi:uncharacterized protein (DUF488 family)
MKELLTVGYEDLTPALLAGALREAGVQLLVDVRAVANSRRPGFSKTRLAASRAEAGIDYLHLRGLGTPAEGRAAARAGKHEEMQRVFAEHLETPEAQTDLEALGERVRSGRRVCLLCLEADPRHCHRTLVARALAERMPLRVVELRPGLATPASSP